MRRTLVLAILLALFLSASCDESTVDPPPQEVGLTWETLILRDIDYAKDRLFFFVNPYSGGFLPDISRSIFVFRELKPSEMNPGLGGVFAGRAFIDEDGTGASINDAIAPLAIGGFPSATSEQGWFELLEFGVDYRFIVSPVDLMTVIGIELVRPISDSEQRVLAVTYTHVGPDGVRDTGDEMEVGGQRYSELWGGPGTFPPNPETPDTTVFKLLKSRTPSLSGEFAELWHYMCRGVYDTRRNDLADASIIEVTIEDRLSPRENPTTPEGSDVPYVQIFGLDQHDEAGWPIPDGLADLHGGMLDRGRGFLTFPVPAPFAPPHDSVQAWTNGEFAFEGPYQAQYDVSKQIYETRTSSPMLEDLHQYIIRVRVGRQAN